MSLLGNFYNGAYCFVCGKHPYLFPWHFQWLAVKDLYSDLRRILPQLHGRVLDVGCGDKPYQSWLGQMDKYIGIDVVAGSKVDVVIESGKMWPLENAMFDVVLCTQVIEHVADSEYMLKEIYRVLKPGGQLIVTIPFIYNEHGTPADYRRLSVHGVKQLFAKRYEIVALKQQGGIGSTMGLLFLNWIETAMNQFKPIRILKGMLLPIWIVLCGTVNGLGWLIDKLDRTGAFYSNTLLVARKPCA